MATAGGPPTHRELVVDEILRQFDDRVNERVHYMQRPLGHATVSDEKARQMWWQRIPPSSLPLVQQQIAQTPQITPWQITTLLYPYRQELWDGALNEGGYRGALRFFEKMRTPPGLPHEYADRIEAGPFASAPAAPTAAPASAPAPPEGSY